MSESIVHRTYDVLRMPREERKALIEGNGADGWIGLKPEYTIGVALAELADGTNLDAESVVTLYTGAVRSEAFHEAENGGESWLFIWPDMPHPVADHAHTPTRIGLIAAWRKYNDLTLTQARDEVDVALAAAEQRGAARALRDTADIRLGNGYYEMLVEDELNARADLWEGDDD